MFKKRIKEEIEEREEGVEEDREWGEKEGRKKHPSYPMGKSSNVYFTKKNIQMASIKNVQPIGHQEHKLKPQ